MNAVRRALLAICFPLLIAPLATAQPQGVAAPLRRALTAPVELGDGGLLRLWPAAAAPSGDGGAGLGIALPSLQPGGLLGVVEVGDGWRDYKGQGVAAGVYTLRYLVEPEDGYHLGVSLYRDFALLVPAAEDAEPTPWAEEELITAAAGSAGGNHPAVLALWPADGRAPGERFDNDMGQPTLAVAVGELTVGVVLEGTGEVE